MNDIASEPILDLIRLYKPETFLDLHHILDDNGYYGRYRIMKTYKTKKFRLKIYLPHSTSTYMWPHKNLYILGEGMSRERSSSEWLSLQEYSALLKFLKDNITEVNTKPLHYTNKYLYKADFSKKIIEIMLDHKLILGNKATLKSMIDVTEYCMNVFKGY